MFVKLISLINKNQEEGIKSTLWKVCKKTTYI